jgi:hypothetical protein
MYDTRHSLAAEAHTHAAYEHWAADYQQKKGEFETAHEFARRACEHSKQAAQLSIEAFAQTKVAEAEPISGKTPVRRHQTGSRKTTAAFRQMANLRPTA